MFVPPPTPLPCAHSSSFLSSLCKDAYFQLRMSTKQLDRLSKKAEKEQKQQEAKVGGWVDINAAMQQRAYTS